LADVEHLALLVDHAVDAGPAGREPGVVLDRRDAADQRARRRVLLDRRQAGLFLVLLEVEIRLDIGFRVVRHEAENRDSRLPGPAFAPRHSGAEPGSAPGEEPGIHNHESGLWIPGSRLRRVPE